MRFSATALLAVATTVLATPRYVMYFDQWHKAVLPPKDVTAGVNYVITAFAESKIFNEGSSYTPFMPLSEVRALFDSGTKVCMAIGGWGDTSGFSAGVASEDARKRYAKNVAATVKTLGYDCVDVDWEYPGGNGEDYKRTPNENKVREIDAYPLLLSEIKKEIGDKELSIAVPGREVDMIAFTAQNVPKIDEAVDFVNVMTYDLMNRRENETKHHTSIEDSNKTIDTYIERGMTPGKINLGFAFYAKFFETQTQCSEPVGCEAAVLEGTDGSDTGKSGAVTFEVSSSESQEFKKVLQNGKEDTQRGGQWYWDPATKKFWTWDTPELMARKFDDIVKAKQLGGVFAWSLGEDSDGWKHIKAMQKGVKTL
uniref:chitinase n=1 Tax=Hirsutella thompsonii TaxID=42368 RepID=A0A097F8P1_HIRTH|nr:chitinase [Hirsutella thompsonii]